MKRYKVVVYAICKNEEQFVDRWLDSMREADEIVVTDTGSSDRTVERLRAGGATVYEETVSPWRFDVARNLSLDHVPKDAEICVCTDLDEVLSKGWRKALERQWKPGTKMIRYWYNWSHKADGSPDIRFRYFKIHERNSYRWAYPIHECLKYCGEGPEIAVLADDAIVLDHYPDDTKSRGNYLPLLELAVSENPQDDRMAYYLGREYMYRGLWEKCITTLKIHLSLPSSVWAEERCASMRWIAKSCYRLNRVAEARGWYLRAAAESYMREPYVEFAQMAYELGDWPTAFCMAEEALKIGQPSSVYTNMGYAWDSTPDDLCAIACYRLGMFRRSAAHARAALAFSPNDERLKNNLRLIEEKFQ